MYLMPSEILHVTQTSLVFQWLRPLPMQWEPLNCGAREGSQESLGLKGDGTSQS